MFLLSLSFLRDLVRGSHIRAWDIPFQGLTVSDGKSTYFIFRAREGAIIGYDVTYFHIGDFGVHKASMDFWRNLPWPIAR